MPKTSRNCPVLAVVWRLLKMPDLLQRFGPIQGVAEEEATNAILALESNHLTVLHKESLRAWELGATWHNPLLCKGYLTRTKKQLKRCLWENSRSSTSITTQHSRRTWIRWLKRLQEVSSMERQDMHHWDRRESLKWQTHRAQNGTRQLDNRKNRTISLKLLLVKENMESNNDMLQLIVDMVRLLHFLS